MSVEQQTFVERCLAGQVLANEIDDAVDAWHDGDDPRTLREFLGFTDEEYACWVKDHACVYTILSCRDSGTPFKVQPVDNEWGMAARSNTTGERVDIKQWLPEE
ncbi:MAG: hypothetical protein LBU75_07150 [Desulfovibrio sp.]|jgi:hypothetical protein|uniref:hypothetical protein n=1 Tax=Nitratidesulfovibrio liaohensis TaxID=2604158 RepID=UPI0014233A41|nr:hypothetical protein [Nitratidesulfovibrio liaohensis]MDR3044026.1 hypothetical protein [Desulfovibrio sp.]NHZ46424.1 hypothetical protein [Nitratidesulfovibrio liaohensis]